MKGRLDLVWSKKSKLKMFFLSLISAGSSMNIIISIFKRLFLKIKYYLNKEHIHLTGTSRHLNKSKTLNCMFQGSGTHIMNKGNEQCCPSR